MNDITRQLAIHVRKLRLEINQAHKELQAIGEVCDSFSEKYSPDPDFDTAQEVQDTFTTIKSLQVNLGTAEAKKYALDHRRYRLEWKAYSLARTTGFILFAYTALTAVIVFYSIRSAIAAKESADAAQNAATVATTSMGIEQQAWLMLDTEYSDNHFSPTENAEYIQVPIQFQNIGRTPARNVHGYIVVTEVKAGDTPIIDFNHACCRNGIDAGLIYPTPSNAHTTFADEYTEVGERVKPGPHTGEQFYGRQLQFVIWGRITYDDIFAHGHWITFCHTITKGDKPGFCTDKNTIDTIRIPQ